MFPIYSVFIFHSLITAKDKVEMDTHSDTDQRDRNRSDETSRFIGVHVSPDIKIKFFLCDGDERIQAEINDGDERVDVELPETPNQYNPNTVSSKLKQLLRNFHLRPNYQSQDPRKVYFKPVAPNDKTWEKQNNVLKLPDDLEWICRRNNTISYAYANTVTTWDWTNDTFICNSYQTMKITVLAEDVDGNLVLGDDHGYLFISDRKLCVRKDKSIVNIIHRSSNDYLIQFENNDVTLFNTESEPGVKQTLSKKVTLLDNGMYVTWNENETTVWKPSTNSRSYINFVENGNSAISKIHSIPNAKFFIEYEDGTGTLRDAREKSQHLSLTDPYGKLLTDCTIGKNLLVLDTDTLVYGVARTKETQLMFFKPKSDQKPRPANHAGFWRVVAMSSLSDGSIMYATNTSNSGIHVATRDGGIVFTRLNKELLGDDIVVDSLTELSDGSVAVKCGQDIFILKPGLKDLTENIAYETELLKLQLRYDPTNLELYFELIDYLREGQNDKELYQVSLSGMEAAVKSKRLYEARRFYEHARKKRPNDREPCEIFLSYVQAIPYKQLIRRIQLDLYALTRNVEDLPVALKNKRCKKRLLIGEGDFSFTEALIEKHKDTHPDLSKAIIATDLTATHLKILRTHQGKKQALKERIEELKNSGVNVLFGIDAEQIHRTFKGTRFKRIQWNCPFGEKNGKARQEFQSTIPGFFKACSQLQIPGDRVHVTLIQKGGSCWTKKRQKDVSIVRGSAEARYRLIRKRSFGTEDKKRYPGYVHVKTGTIDEYESGGVEQEFIFEKADEVFLQTTLENARDLIDPSKKNYRIEVDNTGGQGTQLKDCYFFCSTDEDSSDYYESDTNEEL